MAYATLDDLVARYGEQELLDVADRDGDGVPDAAVLAAAIGDAERDVDLHLGQRYAVPLAQVDDVIRRVTCQLARYYLHFSPNETVRAGYKDALTMLGDIRDGRMAFDAPPATSPTAASGRVQGTSATPVFTRDSLAGF